MIPGPFRRFEAVIRHVCRTDDKAYPLHEPDLGEEERNAVDACLRSGWVSSIGPMVEAMEGELGRITGSSHVIATVNGTAALHLALIGVGVGQGDEVIVPPLSFVATANAVVHAGATPHFVDVEPDSFGIDPEALRKRLGLCARVSGGRVINQETGRRIAAIVPVHIFGLPCRIDEIRAIGGEFGIPVVEDAAEALGSFCGERHCGTLGEVGIISFNGNKIVTTGGGGAVLTNDSEIASRIKHIGTTARVGHRWRYWHDQVGFNFRLPNINAALGCAQLNKLSMLVMKKNFLLQKYQSAFDGFSDAEIVSVRQRDRWNCWLIPVRLQGDLQGQIEPLVDYLHDRKLLVRPLWAPLHTLPMYRGSPGGEMPRAEELARRIVCLPSSANLA